MRLIPFEANQSLELAIVLYFKNQLEEEINFITKKDYRKLLGIKNVNSLNESIETYNQVNRISNNNNNLDNNTFNDNLHSNYNKEDLSRQYHI